MLFMCFLSKGNHLLMFNVQLCLTFERVPIMLKFPLHSAIVTIEQKSSAYGYGYYSCSISSSFARTSVVLSSIAQVFY